MGGGGLCLSVLWFLFAKSAPTTFRKRGDTSGAIISTAPKSGGNRQQGNLPAQQQAAAAKKKGNNILDLFKHPAVVQKRLSWTAFCSVLGCFGLFLGACLGNLTLL